MAASDSKNKALKRSLLGLGVVIGLIVVVLAFSRCSTPSTLYAGTVTVDPQQLLGPVNAVAAAQRALQEWAPGSEPQLVEAAWRRSGQSMRVVAIVDGATVQGPRRGPRAERLGGTSSSPPCRGAGAVVVVASGRPPVSYRNRRPLADRGGLLGRLAQRRGHLPLGGHRLPPPSARHPLPGLPDHRAGTEFLPVEGTDVSVVTIEYEAATPGTATIRTWRLHIAVAQDAAGRLQ